MRLRIITLAAALAGSVAFAPAAFSTADTAAEDEGTGSDNFTLIDNLPHSGRGSDIEFATLTYADEAAAAAAGFQQPGLDAVAEEAGIQKDIALAGTTGNKLHLYDVTDPSAVYETAAYDCPANQGDTQVFTRTGQDGTVRTFTTYTVEDDGSAVGFGTLCAKDAGLLPTGSNAGSGFTGTFIIEITDAFAPRAVAFIPVVEGSHNGSVHPSGNYFYNSNSSLYDGTATDGGLPGIEYYDISDFDDIQRLGKLELPPIPASLGTESHDITFDATGDRAYSAALSQGVIINTEDPANPEVLTSFVDPTIQVWHQSDPIDVGDKRFLVIEDEVAGAVPTGQCPNGGVHVYDITGELELNPQKVGYWNIDEARVHAADADSPAYSCTAHVFRLYPEANVMTISYYNGGVRVVDLDGLQGIGIGEMGVTEPLPDDFDGPMVQIGWRRFADSNSWAAKSPRITRDADGNLQDFHVFSNGGRGLDVLSFDAGDAEGAAQARQSSQWLTPAEAELKLGTVQLSPTELRGSLSEYSCLL